MMIKLCCYIRLWVLYSIKQLINFDLRYGFLMCLWRSVRLSEDINVLRFRYVNKNMLKFYSALKCWFDTPITFWFISCITTLKTRSGLWIIISFYLENQRRRLYFLTNKNNYQNLSDKILLNKYRWRRFKQIAYYA